MVKLFVHKHFAVAAMVDPCSEPVSNGHGTDPVWLMVAGMTDEDQSQNTDPVWSMVADDENHSILFIVFHFLLSKTVHCSLQFLLHLSFLQPGS